MWVGPTQEANNPRAKWSPALGFVPQPNLRNHETVSAIRAVNRDSP